MLFWKSELLSGASFTMWGYIILIGGGMFFKKWLKKQSGCDEGQTEQLPVSSSHSHTSAC